MSSNDSGPERKQIEQPLGQNLRRRDRGRRATVSTGGVLLVACGVAIFCVSAAIAFRGQPFRMPVQTAVAATEPVEKTGSLVAERRQAEPDAPETDRRTGGGSVIRIDPPEAGSDNVITIRDPSSPGQDLRVAHLPDRDLLEAGEDGSLPVRAGDGRRPFDVYARSWSGKRGARVAIVIGGLGVSQTGTQKALKTLPPEVTLAFAANGNSLDRWMQEARSDGREIVMQVPLEPFNFPNVNPGPHTLLAEAGADENLANLRWALSRITNYTGIMNYMGARFIADGSAMQPVMRELAERGLMFVDDGSNARSVAENLAKQNGVPFAAGDGAIDTERSRGAIMKRLDEVERVARAEGYAVATGWAFDETIAAVADWAREARKRGVEIVPISAVADDPEQG